jgi:hypothetical protein
MTTLDDSQYCSLRTFRRDGRAVDTPVWFAPGDGGYYLFSAGDAGKVKRLRNDHRVAVAPCDVRGNVQGEWRAGTARILAHPAEVAGAHAAMRRKYGVVMWLFDLGSRLGGRFHKRAYVVFSLEAARPESA